MSHEKRLHDRPVALKQGFFEGNTMSNLLEDAPGKKVLLMGNEALVRGAYEAGLNFACSRARLTEALERIEGAVKGK